MTILLSEQSIRLLLFCNVARRRVVSAPPALERRSAFQRRLIETDRFGGINHSGCACPVLMILSTYLGHERPAPLLRRNAPPPRKQTPRLIGLTFALPSTKSWKSLRIPIKIGGSGGQPGRIPRRLLFPFFGTSVIAPMKMKTQTSSRRSVYGHRLTVEPLESRLLLSLSPAAIDDQFTLNGSHLTVHGTDGQDSIEVVTAGEYRVTLNGTSQIFDAASIDKISVIADGKRHRCSPRHGR